MNTSYDYGSLVRLLIPAISPQFPSEVIFVAGVILWQDYRQVYAGDKLWNIEQRKWIISICVQKKTLTLLYLIYSTGLTFSFEEIFFFKCGEKNKCYRFQNNPNYIYLIKISNRSILFEYIIWIFGTIPDVVLLPFDGVECSRLWDTAKSGFANPQCDWEHVERVLFGILWNSFGKFWNYASLRVVSFFGPRDIWHWDALRQVSTP